MGTTKIAISSFRLATYVEAGSSTVELCLARIALRSLGLSLSLSSLQIHL